MKRYKTYIIGAGSIGALKDDIYDSPISNNILTHAHACYNHLKINLAGIIDINFDKAIKAANKWQTSAYNCISGIDEDIDILIIATPTNTHYELMVDILKLSPKLVIIEKPFCGKEKNCREIIGEYRKANIPILVDYIRRFDPYHYNIEELIKQNHLGKIFQCRFIYTRGFLRDACHAIDLCNLWFGNNLYAEILNENSAITDYSYEDKTLTAYMIYEKCPHIFLTCVDGRLYDMFEIDILTEKGRIVFFDHGLLKNAFVPYPEPHYGNYNTLNNISFPEKTQLNIALINLLNNAIDHLEKNKQLLCTGEDALNVHNVYCYISLNC